MNVLESLINDLTQKFKEYLLEGKYKVQCKMLGVTLSFLAIFEAGKCFGELIYFSIN